MKKLLAVLLTTILLFSFLPTTMANTPSDSSPFSIDISAMSAEAQTSWNSLFEMTNEWSHFGDLGQMALMRPENKGKSLTHLEKGDVMKISGYEPVEMWFNEEELFITTAGERPAGHCNLWYVVIPESGYYRTTNSEVAVEWRRYPIIEGHERAYWFSEYRFMASQLVLPVKSNSEKPCEAIDVFFQGVDRILHKGVITVEFNENGFQLIMKPPVE
ncbi:MAG: hypothetical protein ACOX62_07240 [Christensenellales bacterium]|jgi:hypothetical protein